MRSRTVLVTVALLGVALPATPASAGKPPPPVFTVGDTALLEGWAPGRVEVSRTGNLKKAASVLLTSVLDGGGSAAGVGEFDSGTVLVSFPRNVSTVSAEVRPIDDTDVEGDETFRVLLSSPSTGSVGPAGTVTIVDDDQSGTYTVGPGASLLVQDTTLTGCNELAALLVSDDGTPLETLASGPSCLAAVLTFSKMWQNLTDQTVHVRLALTDVTCGATYYSDGTSSPSGADHASAWDSEEFFTPTGVAITDGSGCPTVGVARQPTALDQGNLQAAGVFVIPAP